MPKKNTKKKSLTYVSIVIGSVALVAVIAFIICINWIVSSAEKRGMESLETFAEQTTQRFSDMLSNNNRILKHISTHIDTEVEEEPVAHDTEPVRKKVYSSESLLHVFKNHRTNWETDNVGVIFSDDTVMGADGEIFSFEKTINPRGVDTYAFGFVMDNRVGENDLLTFALAQDLIVDGKDCKGYFITYPMSIINNLIVDTVYGEDESTFISVVNAAGDTIWRSDAAIITDGGGNIFTDLEDAKFESKGELDRIKYRMNNDLAVSTVYTFLGEKYALSCIPLKAGNYWKVVIGLPYNTIISRSGNNLVTLILVAAVIVIVSMCVTFYFVYRQRSAELSRQKAEVQAARAISETKAKSDFLSRMSHELRTPLNGIIGMIELASRHGDDKQKREEYMKKIKGSSEFLVSLINDILDMAKIENNKIVMNHEPFNLTEMCKMLTSIFTPLAKEKQLKFIMDYDGLVHDCFVGDEMRLKQIIVNLLSNAVKFTDRGGVKCVCRETTTDDKTLVEIVVEDTGRGISKESLERIFRPFEQETKPGARNKPGTGLGLAICFNLAKLAGGAITVNSKVGEGSTFTVTLPLEPSDQVVSGENEPAPENIRLDGINILLVEDNALNAEIAESLLTDSGSTITLAVNGRQACEMFETSKTGRFDVILMDIQMPEMDGLEATRRIRASDHPAAKTIPIIAMTANALNEDRQMALMAGMNDHVSKPIYIDRLCKVILQYCDKKQ